MKTYVFRKVIGRMRIAGQPIILPCMPMRRPRRGILKRKRSSIARKSSR